MYSNELISKFLPPQEPGAEAPPPPGSKPLVLIKELAERDRQRMLRHFLALDSRNRLLRFGSALSDESVKSYVEKIDFERDVVFGVHSRNFRLVGVAHLAFAPRESLPQLSNATTKDNVAEFGVSVSAPARGKGIGSKLFERAAIHCRNADVDTLYLHCLSTNQVMLRIARKAGMEIQRECGEADAYLKIMPANPASVLLEAVEEQVASLDYALKSNVHAAVRLLGKLPGLKGS